MEPFEVIEPVLELEPLMWWDDEELEQTVCHMDPSELEASLCGPCAAACYLCIIAVWFLYALAATASM